MSKFVTAVCETLAWAGYDYPEPSNVYSYYVEVHSEEVGELNSDIYHVPVFEVMLNSHEGKWFVKYDVDTVSNLMLLVDTVRSGQVRKTSRPFRIGIEHVNIA